MSNLKATYTSNTSNNVIEVPLDSSKPLTDSIVNLQREINTFLTNVLVQEKKAKQAPTPIKTVEQDEAEEELKEMAQEEEDNEEKNEVEHEEEINEVKHEEETNEVKQEEDNDSPMAVDGPEVDDKQNVKKQKTDFN